MKKLTALLTLVALTFAMLTGCSGSKKAESDVKLNIAALKGPTAMGMVKLMEDSKDNDNYNFTICGAPDEISPLLAKGELDIAAIPANLAAVLNVKTEGNIRVLAVNTMGVLYIVENGDTVNSVEDLKGRTIYASGKGATPEYALNYVLNANGLVPGEDVTVDYKSEHAECVSALEADETGVAMLPQPFVTTAMMANENTRICIDLNNEWETAAKNTGDNARLITGVIVARKDVVDNHKDAVDAFLKAYKESVDYTNNNIEEASALIESNGIIKQAVAAKAIPYCNITYIDKTEMKDMLSGYLKVLYDMNPESVGGSEPDDTLYYVP